MPFSPTTPARPFILRFRQRQRVHAVERHSREPSSQVEDGASDGRVSEAAAAAAARTTAAKQQQQQQPGQE